MVTFFRYRGELLGNKKRKDGEDALENRRDPSLPPSSYASLPLDMLVFSLHFESALSVLLFLIHAVLSVAIRRGFSAPQRSDLFWIYAISSKLFLELTSETRKIIINIVHR